MSFNAAVRKRDSGRRLEFGVDLDGRPAQLDMGDTVHWFDDFLGDALDARYDVNSGGDAQALDPVISAAVGGVVRLTSGDAGTGVAADGSALAMELNWKANQGGVVLEARVKLSAITNVIVNVGFTDVKPSGTLELPFEVGGSDALTSTATDAVAFVFDTGADTDEWFAAGVADDVDASHVALGVAPAAGTYQTLRIELSDAGAADFFINDQHYATVAAAVTATVALTPILIICADTTTSVLLDVDTLWLTGKRA